MKIKWKWFKDEKPKKPGRYLWAANNWDVRNEDSDRVHTDNVNVYYWNGSSFLDGSHQMIDPDQWVEVPRPEKIPRPTDDLTYQI